MTSVMPVSRSSAKLGECIVWDDKANLLRWTDILSQHLWHYDPKTGTEHFWTLPARLCCFALTQQEGILLLGLEKGLVRFDCRSKELSSLCDVEPHLPTTRVNDGRCDRHGNFVFGTMNEGGDEAIGGWYRYTASGELQKLALPACRIANGICFSPDGGTMYFTDSPTKQIFCCDYNPDSGDTTNIRLFHNLASRYPVGKVPNPDGSIMDAEGGLWNAEWGSGRIARYLPDGLLDQSIELPVSQPTCLAFGGASLDTLFISSANVGLRLGSFGQDTVEGRVLSMLGTGFSGLPESRFG